MLGPVHGHVRGAVAALYEEVAQGRPGGRAATLVGVGGSGKSTVLADLTDAYRGAGVTAHLARSEADLVDPPPCRALLVDDAHRLPGPALEHVARRWAEDGCDVVVAHRPWPLGTDLRRLVTTVTAQRPPVLLGPLDAEEVAACAARALGSPLRTGEAERIVAETGGLLWLVRRTVAALEGVNRPVAEVLPAVARQVGHELEPLDAGVRDLLLSVAVGFDLAGDVLPPVLAGPDGDSLVSAAVAAGVLLTDGGVPPLLRSAVLAVTPAHRVRPLQHALVDTLVAGGRSLDGVARDLARTGLRHAAVARTLEHSADVALPTRPALAAELYEEASAAGSDALATTARRAQSAALAGDLDRAGALVEDLLAHDDPPDLVRAVDVGAAVWAQRGMLARAADLYRWAGPARLGPAVPNAAVALLASGDREGARAMLEAGARHASPTSLAVAGTLAAEGLQESVDGEPARALWQLVRASDTFTANGAAAPVPELPAVMAALVAIGSGDLDVATSVLEGAARGHQGGGAGAAVRLNLHRAWVEMLADRRGAARDILAGTGPSPAPREETLRAALEVGLARREDDAGLLVRTWARARGLLPHLSVDLFSLLALGELHVTAARLGEQDRLAPHLDEAWRLLARLGDPPLWTVPLHWSGVQAAILADRPALLAPHAHGLVAAAGTSRTAAVLAGAGRAWVRVLGDDVDVAEVERAARGLSSVGLPWDGARLAGHAAARAPERSGMARLLACARDLHPSAPVPPGDPGGAAGDGAPRAGTGGLSAREVEVARLVLAGKTYREIGEAIFISPRTAEHHIARIRRRLGAETRAELLTRLRLLLGD